MENPRPLEPHFRVEVKIDGRDVPLKPFLHEMFGGAVRGLVTGLKDVTDPRVIEMRVVCLDDPSD